jgi:hypothetical protein
MSLPAAWPQVLDFFGTSLVIEPSAGQRSNDAGLLPIRQLDQRMRPGSRSPHVRQCRRGCSRLLVSDGDMAATALGRGQSAANDRWTNQLFVVSNGPGAALVPGPTYDEYAGRGESENRNKSRTTRLADALPW